MAAEAGEARGRVAERLAAVCACAEEIRRDLREGATADDEPLENVLAAARAEAPGGSRAAAALDALHTALRADGDVLGLDGYAEDGAGVLGRSLRPAGLAGNASGSSGAHGGEVVYLCPDGRCRRVWWPQGPAPVPRCAVSGAAMRRERL